MTVAAQAPAARGANLRGMGLVLGAMLFFALMDGVSKYLATRYPAPQILWVRYLLSVPLAVALAAPRGGLRLLWRSGRPGLQLLRSAIITVEMMLVVYAFSLLPLADAHAILAATPLVVTALAVPMLGERVGWRRWLAVGAGFLGILVMVRPGASTIGLGTAAALAAVVLYALYQILTRLVGHTDRAETSFFLQFAIGSVLLSVVGPFTWQWPEPWHWPLFAVLAALGAGGHLLFIRALQSAPAVVLQPFTYTLLVWAVAIGWLGFGDWPDRYTLVGMAIVVAAGLYAAWRERARGAGV